MTAPAPPALARRALWTGIFGRQVIREIALHVLITTAATVALYVSVDSVEAVNRALSRATLADLARLQLYSIPGVLQQFATVLVLIGGLTGIAALVRRQEIVALFAAGAGPGALLRPVLVAGAMIALLYGALTEWIAPAARAEVSAARLRLGLPASPADSLGGSRTWFRGEDLVYRIQVMEAANGSVLGGVLMLRIRDGRLLDRWDVRELRFEGGRWTGLGVIHRRFEDASDAGAAAAAEAVIATEQLERTVMPVDERPEDFVTSIGAPDRLSYFKLLAAMRARERLGQPALGHRFELYRRHAYPLSLVVALALAAAIALRLGRRPTMAVALGAGVLIGFVVWLTDEVSLALGTAAALSPELAAHLPLALLLMAAAFAWARAARDGLRSR